MTFSKTSIYLFIFFFAAMAVSPEPVFARDPDKAVSKRASDGDGKVSDSEWKGSSMAFERIDGNGDGYITAKEFATDWGISYTDDSNDSPAAGKGAGTGLPIADLHFHPAQNFTAGDAAQWFDANGGRWAGSGVKGANMGGASTRKQYADALAGRYIAFGGQSDLNGIFKSGGLLAAAATLETQPLSRQDGDLRLTEYAEAFEQAFANGAADAVMTILSDLRELREDGYPLLVSMLNKIIADQRGDNTLGLSHRQFFRSFGRQPGLVHEVVVGGCGHAKSGRYRKIGR